MGKIARSICLLASQSADRFSALGQCSSASWIATTRPIFGGRLLTALGANSRASSVMRAVPLISERLVHPGHQEQHADARVDEQVGYAVEPVISDPVWYQQCKLV